MSNQKQKEILIVLLCLFLGFALRFYTFDQKSLWIDEIHTFNDSRDGIRNQLKYYKENPTYLHPPLFFVLTHSFYPFTKPERDLRIIPLIFGILSIPMLYLLSRRFSQNIAIPCTISLTFMTFHIYLSQNGRPYSLIMFIGMAGLYFFVRHLQTLRILHLIPAAFFFASLFYTSYSSIQFIVLSQILWFYPLREDNRKPVFSSCLIFNGMIFFLCLPWLLFLGLNYHGQPIIDPIASQDLGPLSAIVYGILNDWVPHLPLMIISSILLIVFPFFSKNRRNAFILLGIFVLPIGGLYLYCKLLNVTQFITSRYFINFFPIFLIVLFLSVDGIELRPGKFRGLLRLKLLFVILFIASNLVILPLYYRSEKQDFRGLVNYLNSQVRDGDKIVLKTFTYIPGILHYFNVYPKNRHYEAPIVWTKPGKEFELKMSLISEGRLFTIYYSNIPYVRYVADGNRLWIITGKEAAREIKNSFPCALKGFFDGSFANFRRFPSDASMYLFLWDPKSPGEKGIDMPID
ncbi:MAG: Oligosaccharyl transferase subunit [Deltaproteobacteria bacterium]|nr:Oligosaccharyl transferase subunit [Deltaproteobacteria bacterium]